jgi:ubiquinol-cytochrome c reductase cytochrome c subunit
VALVVGLAAVLRVVPLAPPALAAEAAQASPSASTTVGGDAAAGRDLFLANCASCHGPQGQGSAVAPGITGAGAALADYVLRTGRMPLPDPNAPSQRRPVLFSDDQIRALVGFIASLDSGPAIPNVAISGADLALGRSLFIDNCAACHGAGGAGGAVGGGFIAPNLHDADPTTVGEAVTVGPGPMPRFAFTSERLNALAAYVQELRHEPDPGGLPIAQLGPVPEGFLAGFVGIVLLLILVRWIGRRPMGEADAGGDVTAPGPTPIENP